MKETFRSWINGETDPIEELLDSWEESDPDREERKSLSKERIRTFMEQPGELSAVRQIRNRYTRIYYIVAVLSCIFLSVVLLYTVSLMPGLGKVNPRATEVSDRYIEKGVEETGAVNAVAGMILDYRAFDTLGESHVLFTALICVMILLRVDSKNQRQGFEDYYATMSETYFASEKDTILKTIGIFLVPCIFIYGIYVLLNGQNSPGGGFSGGAIMGAAMIIFTSAFGFDRVDRFFTLKLQTYVTFVALSFYSFAKGYVFFTGANGLENHIPKGTPGAILSGGLILPLDVAVGLVVACTMFGFYSLFRRGQIGGTPGRLIS